MDSDMDKLSPLDVPPKSPSGLYEWVNRYNDCVEAVIGEEERKELMMGKKARRQDCILRILTENPTGPTIMITIDGPPTSPSGFYQWQNIQDGNIEAIVSEKERKELMMGTKMGRHGCELIIMASWYQVSFDLKPLATTTKILEEITSACHWRNYAIFISEDEVCMVFKLDPTPQQEFLNMLQYTVNNLHVLPINAEMQNYYVRSLMAADKWDLRGYLSKAFGEILNTLVWGLSNDEKKHGYMSWRGLPE